MRVVIVGAGHAGVALADALKRNRFNGTVTILNDEDQWPYHRPPLSKGISEDARAVPLRPPIFYGHGITLERGLAVDIDLSSRRVGLEGGGEIAFDRLVLALGARCRTLSVPGSGLPGIFTLRSHADALRLGASLKSARRMVVVGGGYVGLEVAAAARRRGVDVTVVERGDRILGRSASKAFAAFVEGLHLSEGVKIMLSRSVVSFSGTSKVERVHFDDGSELNCDCVLVGIGAVPNVELAEQAGLSCRNGILVDGNLQTSHPDVFAIGDCANAWNNHYRRRIRFESIGSALAQARTLSDVLHRAATRALDAVIDQVSTPQGEIPWFWSDQYDRKLQMAGLQEPGDDLIISAGLASDTFCALHARKGRITAVETCGVPLAFVQARKAIESAGVVADVLATP